MPFALGNGRANLRGGLAFARLFITVEILVDADVTSRAVLAGETIEKAIVALAAVAMAIARFLIQRFLDFPGQSVCVLHHGICE